MALRVKKGSEIAAGGLHVWVVVCLVVDVGAESLEWEQRVFGGLLGVALRWMLIISCCSNSMALQVHRRRKKLGTVCNVSCLFRHLWMEGEAPSNLATNSASADHVRHLR